MVQWHCWGLLSLTPTGLAECTWANLLLSQVDDQLASAGQGVSLDVVRINLLQYNVSQDNKTLDCVMPPCKAQTEPTFMSTRDLATYLAGQRIGASPSTLSRWSQQGGPWGFPLPDQQTAATPLWRQDRIDAWVMRYAKVKDLSGYRLSQLLRAYADAGRHLRPSRRESAHVGVPARMPVLHDAMAQLVAAYRGLEATLATKLRSLVAASEARLGGEPLLLPTFENLIAVDDENAVSNVLREILRLLPKSAAFEMLGLDAQRLGDALPVRVEREWSVAEGHAGCGGRLDLVAVYPDGEWLIIETKVVSAEAADLKKNAGYARSLGNAGLSFHAACLVLGGAATADGHGFALIDWRATLLRLRGAIARLRHSPMDQNHGVLLVALIGVLERRLLDLRLDLRHPKKSTLDYLNEFHTGTRA